MPFSKAFPKRSDKSAYPVWVDVELSEEEERAVDESARQENLRLMDECLSDAKELLVKRGLVGEDENIVAAGIALFEKRASHAVYHKERKAKEKMGTNR
ncbi:MAG: hypothetical protein ABIC95_00495 [archaeon]